MRPMKVRGKGRIACVFWALGTALVLGGCQRGADAKPLKLTFSQESGCYENPFELELSTEKGDIYYTLDGSDPRDSDTRIAYKGAISVTDRSGDANVLSAIDPAQYDAVNVEWDSEKQDFVSTIVNPKDDEVDKMTVVRAVAQSSGRSSDVVTQSYFVGDMTEHVQGIEQSCDASGQDLAIMSITVNSSDMFDSKTGIYVKGDIYQKALEDLIRDAEDSCPDVETGRRLDGNYTQRGKDWERAAHVDYFESDGKTTVCRLQQDCGIRIQGNYSRSDLQKGLRLCGGKKYGKKNFSYPFFGDKDVDDRGEVISSFRKLILRNGGNCAFTTKFNDTYWQKQLADLKVETQASRPCVVYLNGEYWGLYILQEDYQAKYFEKTHGVAKENVVTYKGDAEALSLGYKLDEGKLPEGEDNESYYLQDVLDFFASHDNLRNEQDYEAFAKLVDPESVRDYFAANVWLNNKWDWPGKNWTIWKTTKVDPDNPYADGRWRLCFYDLDFGGVSGVEDIGTNTMAEDNYKKYGLLDKKTANPLVKMFVYLMSNDSFRRDFEDKLLSLSENELEKEHALAECKKIREIYESLYPQFFTRYFGTEQAEYKTEDAIGGGYASYQCLVDFLGGRADTIPGIVNWIEKTEKRLE